MFFPKEIILLFFFRPADVFPQEIILLFFFRPGGLMFFPNEIFKLLGFPIV
jgi:hypothetical protein